MRFNITLPAEIGQRLKASNNHSAQVAESLRQKFARDDKAQLSKILAEGYQARASDDKSLAQEFDHTLQDGR
jgi:hypothetical protein